MTGASATTALDTSIFLTALGDLAMAVGLVGLAATGAAVSVTLG